MNEIDKICDLRDKIYNEAEIQMNEFFDKQIKEKKQKIEESEILFNKNYYKGNTFLINMMESLFRGKGFWVGDTIFYLVFTLFPSVALLGLLIMIFDGFNVQFLQEEGMKLNTTLFIYFLLLFAIRGRSKEEIQLINAKESLFNTQNYFKLFKDDFEKMKSMDYLKMKEYKFFHFGNTSYGSIFSSNYLTKETLDEISKLLSDEELQVIFEKDNLNFSIKSGICEINRLIYVSMAKNKVASLRQ